MRDMEPFISLYALGRRREYAYVLAACLRHDIRGGRLLII